MLQAAGLYIEILITTGLNWGSSYSFEKKSFSVLIGLRVVFLDLVVAQSTLVAMAMEDSHHLLFPVLLHSFHGLVECFVGVDVCVCAPRRLVMEFASILLSCHYLAHKRARNGHKGFEL